jgi:hypothetical protein
MIHVEVKQCQGIEEEFLLLICFIGSLQEFFE